MGNSARGAAPAEVDPGVCVTPGNKGRQGLNRPRSGCASSCLSPSRSNTRPAVNKKGMQQQGWCEWTNLASHPASAPIQVQRSVKRRPDCGRPRTATAPISLGSPLASTGRYSSGTGVQLPTVIASVLRAYSRRPLQAAAAGGGQRQWRQGWARFDWLNGLMPLLPAIWARQRAGLCRLATVWS